MQKLVILGVTPSKKNSRRPFVRGGRMMNFPSKQYAEWQKDALWQLKGAKPVTVYPVAITMVFHMKDKRGRDLDNMAASVLDVLQDSGIIANDDCWHACPISLDCAGVSKEPKVEIFIDEEL